MSRPVFTPTVYAFLGQKPVTHWFWDARTKGWVKDQYADYNHNPTTLVVFDGDNPSDRAILFGGFDGYIRKVDKNMGSDDGGSIMSYVTLGPFTGSDRDHRVILSELQTVTDNGSAPVKYEVSGGDTPDLALAGLDASFAGDGTFQPGLSAVANPRIGGRYIYVRIGTTAAVMPWALEKVRARITDIVTSRRRSQN